MLEIIFCALVAVMIVAGVLLCLWLDGERLAFRGRLLDCRKRLEHEIRENRISSEKMRVNYNASRELFNELAKRDLGYVIDREAIETVEFHFYQNWDDSVRPEPAQVKLPGVP